MSTTNYIYGGPSHYLGRFGLVNQGDILGLTDAEVASVLGDSNYAPVPSLISKTILEKTSAYTLLSGDSGKALRSKHTAAVVYMLPSSPAVGDNYEIQDASSAGAGTNKISLDPGSNLIGSLGSSIASIAVTTPGTGFTSRPTVAIAGGGTGATATATLKVVGVVAAAAGSGYTAGDVLTAVGGTGTAATFTVATVDGLGAITGLTILTAGSYTALPSNPVATTVAPSGGTGATLTLTWGVAAITVTAIGSGYLAPTAAISGGGGTGAVLDVTPTGTKQEITTNAGIVGLVWDGAKWSAF